MLANPAIFKEIKRAIETAPRNAYVAEFHVQVIKHAGELENVSGKAFCAALELGPAWGTEFVKMRKIAPRLFRAGLNPAKL